MIDIGLSHWIFLAIAGFLAAFIDSMVGGGGVISLPAMLWVGFDPRTALATNKGAAFLAVCLSSYTFLKSGKTDPALLKRLVPVGFASGVLGALLMSCMPPDFLRPFVVVMLAVVACYTLFRKDFGTHNVYEGLSNRVLLRGVIIAFVFGVYDGFFGPGTGSFLIFSLLWLGFDFISAAANAKVLNCASNVGGCLTFAVLGYIDYRVAALYGFFMLLGAFLGTRLALSKGSVLVRPAFIGMTVIMIGRQVWVLIRN